MEHREDVVAGATTIFIEGHAQILRYRPTDRQGTVARVLTYGMWMTRFTPLLLVVLGACGKPSGGATCGFTAMAGATLLLEQFGVPDQTLSTPPSALPERVVVRLAAGPAYSAIVGRTGQKLVIGMEGNLPSKVRPGFGVLVVDPSGKPRGVMLYESAPIRGAPELGSVAIDSVMVPLLGIQLPVERYEDSRCPFFPDSVHP